MARLSNLKINPGAEVNTKEFNFPVSSFFDVFLKNTTMVFAQSLKFMPGMSMIADGDSKVMMSYDSSSGNAAQLSVLDRSAYYYDSEMLKFETNDLISDGDTMGFGKVFFTSENLWKYFSGNRIKVYGTLIFQGGNKSVKDYLLAGPIDFHRVAYSPNGAVDNLETD